MPELDDDRNVIEPAVRRFYDNRIRWLIESAEHSRREASQVGQPMKAALLRKAEGYEKDALYFRAVLDRKSD